MVISVSLTEAKWAESLRRTLKEALVFSFSFSINSATKTDTVTLSQNDFRYMGQNIQYLAVNLVLGTLNEKIPLYYW